MRRIIIYSIAALSFGASISTTLADEETCAACDRLVQATGEFSHYQTPKNVTIQGVPAGSDAAFREEIFGKSFTVTISQLAAGKYTVVIGEAETFFSQPGQRVFDVSSGDTSLATNFDIVAT